MRFSFCCRGLMIFFGLLGALVARGQPVVESIDRFELNYSSMRIKFYGEANADFSHKGLEGAEKTATDDALAYALSGLGKLRLRKGLAEDSPNGVASELTKQSFIVNTVYFANGKVRVELESSLAKAMDNGHTDFKGDEPQTLASEASAIIIQIDGLKQPLLAAEIRSPEGELLYGPKDVAKSAYKKQMLGRWFYKNSPELKAYLGHSPVVIEAVSVSEKAIILSKEGWDKLKLEHPRLVEEAKLAFVFKNLSKSTRNIAQ